MAREHQVFRFRHRRHLDETVVPRARAPDRHFHRLNGATA